MEGGEIAGFQIAATRGRAGGSRNRLAMPLAGMQFPGLTKHAEFETKKAVLHEPLHERASKFHQRFDSFQDESVAVIA